MSVTYYLMDDPDTIMISTMAERGKANAAVRNPKVSLCVLDENWPPVYVQVYCDARIDAKIESAPERVIDSMMRLYQVMADKPMPHSAQANAGETALREKRVILLLKSYATFETPSRHVYSERRHRRTYPLDRQPYAQPEPQELANGPGLYRAPCD